MLLLLMLLLLLLLLLILLLLLLLIEEPNYTKKSAILAAASERRAIFACCLVSSRIKGLDTKQKAHRLNTPFTNGDNARNAGAVISQALSGSSACHSLGVVALELIIRGTPAGKHMSLFLALVPVDFSTSVKWSTSSNECGGLLPRGSEGLRSSKKSGTPF